MALNHLRVNYHFVTYSCMKVIVDDTWIYLRFQTEIVASIRKRQSQKTLPLV